MSEEKQWLPLESNPALLNNYMYKLGGPADLAFYDVMGFDAELLEFVPKPVHAAMLLFPITAESEAAKQAQQEHVIATGVNKVPEGTWYMRQTVGNACGTIGLIHTLAVCLDLSFP